MYNVHNYYTNIYRKMKNCDSFGRNFLNLLNNVLTIHNNIVCLCLGHSSCSDSTCVGASMRDCQWTKCQCAHATSCSDHPKGN